MPITGRTGSRNYRQRRTFSSSSESESSPEPEAMRPVIKSASRPRSRSPSHRSHSPPRAHSMPRHSHSPFKSPHRLPPTSGRDSRSPTRKRRLAPPASQHKSRSHSSHRSSLSPVSKRHRLRDPSDLDRYHHHHHRHHHYDRYERDSDRRRYHSRDRSGHHSSHDLSSGHRERWPPSSKYSKSLAMDSSRSRDRHPSRDKYPSDSSARNVPPPRNTDNQSHQAPHPLSDVESVAKRNHYPDKDAEYSSGNRGLNHQGDGSPFQKDRVADGYHKSSSPIRDGKNFSAVAEDSVFSRKPPETKVGNELDPNFPSDRFGQTLDERFKAVAVENNRCLEPRIHYTREDLEKITVDIRRNLREPSPTIRRIINPEDIKVVRRIGEGSRPIFDREEIKMAPVDLREDAFFERRVVAIVKNANKDGGGTGGGSLPSGSGPPREVYQDLDNTDNCMHKFNNFGGNTGVMLSERWQGKMDGPPLTHEEMIQRDCDRDHFMSDKSLRPDGSRSDEERLACDRSFSGASEQHVTSGDEKRYSGRDSLDRRRKDERDFSDHYSSDPNDLRHSLEVRRTSSDSRPRSTEHRDYHPSDRERPHGQSSSWHREQKLSSESSLGKYKDNRNLSSSRLSHSSDGSFMDDMDVRRDNRKVRERPEGMSDFVPSRTGHYKYNSWLNKSDLSSKGPSYYEHDDRDISTFPSRGRGRGRGLRGRGFLGFRGRPRGLIRGKMGFFRGRGYIPSRRGKSSPSHWEHDLFDVSPDSKYVPSSPFKSSFGNRYDKHTLKGSPY